ncbi:hypothetical protein DEO72_LG3g1718 [Vigna unguiculata]|uniref:Uncharacterized protein n=1 Tax=Vigna unguiculata TaxID=3917 RepID=A0A4D6LG84_VIGUN|nr:hypothetical protein DEO72_LG3g1718 [Vigna unguiculata]
MGRMGSPQADARSTHVPRHAMRCALPSTIATMTSPRAFQQPGLGPPSQSASINAYFVHTARRSYRLNGPVKCSDCGDVGDSLPATW